MRKESDWEYLRGKHGIKVCVMPVNNREFVVKLHGGMGWSEGLFETEDSEGKWGGSGTYKVFNSFDVALDAGIKRVDYLYETMVKQNFDKL